RTGAVPVTRRPREEQRTAQQAGTLSLWQAAVAYAVRVERCVAVRADDPHVLEPVVVVHAVDMVEDQRHAPSVPHLVLAAELAAALFQTLGEETLLQKRPLIGRTLDEDVSQGNRLA